MELGDQPLESGEPAGYCPSFQHAIELIGRRWTGSILRAVGEHALRFGEIRSAVPGLSDRLLDARLTELESEGILSRSKNHGEVRYSATPIGVDLMPVLHAIDSWSQKHSSLTPPLERPGRRRC